MLIHPFERFAIALVGGTALFALSAAGAVPQLLPALAELGMVALASGTSRTFKGLTRRRPPPERPLTAY